VDIFYGPQEIEKAKKESPILFLNESHFLWVRLQNKEDKKILFTDNNKLAFGVRKYSRSV